MIREASAEDGRLEGCGLGGLGLTFFIYHRIPDLQFQRCHPYNGKQDMCSAVGAMH